MPKKIKYVLTASLLIGLILVAGACSIYIPDAPASSPPTNPIGPTDPDWTFPPKSGQAALQLPSIAEVVAQVMPSVVAVTTERVAYDIFRREYMQTGAGSGAIIDADGYIITNNHVIEDSKTIKVKLADGRILSADIVGADALTDLAVIKVEAMDLVPVVIGDSSQLALGDWVVAIGNALGEGISATQGIVSRLDVSVAIEGNTLYGLTQTTAAINPGNSGGPLVNMAGEIIGITSVKMATLGVEGMGYAISMHSAEPIIEDLVSQGYVATRPWLGVQLYTVDAYVAEANDLSVDKGVLVVEVVADSPADKAGLEAGDIIISFGGEGIANVDDLVQAIRNSEIGQSVEITFVRGEDIDTVSAKLIESPSPWR